MSDFLNRNKKKGSLAALLLFLQRGKGVGPLLALVALLSFIFIAPASFVLGIPFVGPFVEKLGLRSALGGGQPNQAQLEEALRLARARRDGLAAPGALFGRDGVGQYGRSTVDFVKGREGDKAKTYDENAGEARTIDGVVRPEDAKKMEEGVELKEGELANGLLNPAYADGVGLGGTKGDPGEGPKADFGKLSGFGGGSGNSGGFSGRPFDPTANLVGDSLAKNAVPKVASSRNLGGAGGKLSQREFRRMNAQVSGAVGNARGSGRSTALYQLAEGRAYSIAAAPPPGKCDPNSCPNEYARNISGAVFDGSKPRGGIISSPELGDPATPNVPNEGEIGGMIDEAEQIEKDAEACERANEVYGPQMDASNRRTQELSDRLNSMNCNGGGCSKSKAKKCQAVGDQMRAECRNSNQISQNWANACPLTNGNFSRMNCNQ